MAVTVVNETWASRRGSFTDDAQREYTREFRAITNNTLDGPLIVKTAVSSLLYDAYLTTNESDLGATARTIECEQDQDNPFFWKVTVQYASRAVDPEQFVENPLLRPAEWEWGSAQYEEAMERDVDGRLVANTAGDPFDPPPTRPKSYRTLTLTRNEISFDPVTTHLYENTVNSTTFLGFPPGYVLCKSITSRILYEAAARYFSTTYSFEMGVPRFAASVASPYAAVTDGIFNPYAPGTLTTTNVDVLGPWQLQILNTGYRELVGGVLVAIQENGQPVSKPALLDTDGTQLAVGGDPVWLVFRKYPSVDFTPLSLVLI